MNSLSDKKIDQLVSAYGEEYTPDVEQGLQKLHARLGMEQKETTVRQLPRRRWLSVAAAILLLCSAAYFLFPGQETVVYANSGESPMEVKLADGTVAVLQSGTTLSHDPAYNEVDRRIQLDGQAFLQVQKDKSRPFFVASTATELRVTGTAFNLRIAGEELEVEVSEGSVELTRENEKLAVTANQCGLSRKGKTLQLMEAPNLNRHAWRTGKMVFEDASLAEVLEAMRTNFGFSVKGNKGCDFPVSGSFSTDNPVAILETIAKLGGGELETSGSSGQAFRLMGICQ
ncbi:FecR family protein [Neolewinella agarilytica]|uniref:FecR family protein n=1 Tax=Neolewinella agarilytica TaxID=478744 RepID=UPI002354480E|nr:FecR domain-containing protein [Neolewinella agarilytica]